MPSKKGLIVLMGSGELTSTMVEVHKDILQRVGSPCNAVFLDTPAGFQLNVDELSQRAVDYFLKRVQHPMQVVSFKSKDIPPLEAEKAYSELKKADYILVGPGSPTYAVRQWIGTPIPDIITRRIRDGACFVAASAAALTVGKLTMPVYEIYKVGEELHWVEGMEILGKFGINAVVIPHWNNAEGGTHDTRCCFIGESRFRELASRLPQGTGVIGIDEHTACIIDLESEEAEIRGIGSVVIEYEGKVSTFQKGEKILLDFIRGGHPDATPVERIPRETSGGAVSDMGESHFWEGVHTISDNFHSGIDGDPSGATNAVLELDSIIWKAHQELENPEFITQAREILREFIVLLGTRLASSPAGKERLKPLVDALISLREDFRKAKKWTEADAMRDCLKNAGILVEDTPDGPRWRVEVG